MNRLMKRHAQRDRGAAAVEFALLLPVLLLLVFGLIDFGRGLNAQVTLTQAAREGARADALGQPNVVTRTTGAATGLSGVSVSVVYQCQTGDAALNKDATVKASYSFSFVTPLKAIASMFGSSSIGSTMTLSATGVMPCET